MGMGDLRAAEVQSWVVLLEERVDVVGGRAASSAAVQSFGDAVERFNVLGERLPARMASSSAASQSARYATRGRY